MATYDLFKSFFDRLAASVGIIVLGPLLLLTAFIIKIDSAGPIFYRGIRTGKSGRKFRIFKFRTMYENRKAQGGPSTGRDDPRVSRVGRVLRRWKFDELPQLINVLLGEMSIVGPRPEVPQYTELYTDEEKQILNVKPGLTDFASIEFIELGKVLGNKNVDLVYEQQVKPIKNKLRIKYVQERSFIVDLRLIFQTIARLVRI